MAKTVFIIVDGMADLPIKMLNNKTPLEYAYKPNITLLLKNAAYAYPSVLGKLAPQSDAGVMADLGYDPIKYSTGRGWFECVGLGMKPTDGDLSIRVNFGEVNNGKLSSVRVYMSKEELKDLEDEINSKVRIPAEFDFKSGEGYRAGLVIRKGKVPLSAYVSNNEPGYTAKFYPNGKKLSFASGFKDTTIKPVKAMRREGAATARLLNTFIKEASRVIKESKVYRNRVKNKQQLPNFLFIRDAAVRDPRLPDINETSGKKWCAVAGMPLEKGIAESVGMELVDLSEYPSLNEDLTRKADAAVSVLKSFDCVYIHIKQTDSASHLGKYTDKYAIIEVIDRILISRLSKVISVDKGDTLVMTCDHATSSELKRHIDSNIPVLIVNKRFGRSNDFGETACRKNHLKQIRKATDIIPFMTKLWRY